MKGIRQRCLGMGLQNRARINKIAESTGSEENTSVMSGNGPANRARINKIAESTGSEENTSAMSGSGPANRGRIIV